jgi:hypothetical protein
MFGSGDGFPFMVGGAPASVTSAHPSPIQMFQLWQVYISNVNPLLKITHTPTLQADIISASANPSKISRPLEALMFAIYFSAVTSLTEDEVQTMFGEDRSILLGRYHNATQQALVNAEFMKSTELAVLQAFFLYLVLTRLFTWPRLSSLSSQLTCIPIQLSARPFVDPRSLYTLLGLAFRIATRLNLHRDGIDSNMPPFEVEQRRRLWWQIVVFDKRIAEITGSAMTILSSGATTTRLPLNINDSDLNIQAKVPPASYAGPTEMTFALTRIELTVAACPDSVRQSVSTPGGGPIQKPMVHYDNHSPSSTDVISHVTNQHLPNDLAAFCAYMENVYLKQCDTKVPLQYFTILMTRQNLCKLRIIDFLCRSANSDNISQAERDSYFLEALRMIEYDNLLQSAESIKGFRWYTYAHFPLPGYLCLVSELRHRTTGELCERAWDVMIENHERRGLLRRLNRNPLHIAFGRYLVKAWDAREAAELQNGRILETPQVVQLLRNALGMSAKLTAPPQQPQPQQQHQQPQDPSQYPPRHPSASAGMSNAPVPHAIHPQPGISPHTSSLASAAPTPNPGGMPTAVGMNNMAVSSVGRAPTSMYSSPANPAMAQSSNTPPQLHPQHSQPSLTSAGGGSAMGGNLMVADDDPAGGSAATAAMMYAASYESTPTPTQGAGMFGSGSGSVPGGGGGGGSGGGMPGQDQLMPPVMDWDYLVQMTSLGGFNAAGYYGGGGI